LLATIGQAGIRMFVPTESLQQQGRIITLFGLQGRIISHWSLH
jgi:hypothetical protein